jgi:hypothetical protein
VRRWLVLSLVIGGLLVCAAPMAQADPGVPNEPPGVVADLQGERLPAEERARLEKTLAAYGPEKWQVLFVDQADDPTVYLDTVWNAWAPEPETLLLIVFSRQGTARLQLGAGTAALGLKWDQVYPILKSEYNPRAQQGKYVDGILAMAKRVHDLVVASGVAAVAPQDPTGQDAAVTAGATPSQNNQPDQAAADTGEQATGAAAPAQEAAVTGNVLGEAVTWMLVGGAVALGLGLLPGLIRRLRSR